VSAPPSPDFRSSQSHRDVDDPKASHEWVQMRCRQWAHLDEIYAGLPLLLEPVFFPHPPAQESATE
jgi:hypothetical protein